LLVQERWSLSLSGLAKQKGIEKDILDCFVVLRTPRNDNSLDSRLRGNDGENDSEIKDMA
jgi:hypothetical protein